MDIELSGTNTSNSPRRKVLGDIKNVSGDSPGNPVSPTANLKLLTRVASQFIKRDFGDCLFNDKSPVKIEDNSSENTCKELSERTNKNNLARSETPKGRKDKSLSILCDKFLELFPLDVKPGSNICISLDHAAAQLGTERRRLYDIINVLESLQIASKIGKNCYQWFGKQQLCKTLVELKILATKLGYENKIQAMQNWRCCSSGSSTFTEISNSQSADTTRDERSLGILCQKFLMLFLASKKTDLVNLDMAAHVVINASEMEHSRSNFKEGDSCKMCHHKAKARRLYDIANVLISLGLIRKVRSLDCLMRKPAFQYCGPDIDTEVLNLTNEVSLPVHATRHSLLRPTNFEMDCQGRKRSASGSRSFEKFKRTQSDSVLVPSQFGLSAVEDDFLASDNWKNEPNDSLIGDLRDSAKDNADFNKCKELKAQAYDQITLIPIGMEVDWKNSVKQSKETLGQLHVIPGILSGVNGSNDMRKRSDTSKSSTNFVRHNSEPCVSKSSILVKRKLVKVTPLNKASDCTLTPIGKSALTQLTEVDNTFTKSAVSHSDTQSRMIDVNAKKSCIIVTQGQLELQVKKGKTFNFSKEEFDIKSLSSSCQNSGQDCDLACHVPKSCPPLIHTPISIQNELHSSSRLQVAREYINTTSEIIKFPFNSFIPKPAINKISSDYSCESDKSSHVPTVLIPLKQSGVLQNTPKSAKKVNEINNGVLILSNKYPEANKNSSVPSDNCESSSVTNKPKIGCITPQNSETTSLTHSNESDIQCLIPHNISPIPGSVPNILNDNTRNSCNVEGVLLPTVVPGELYTAVKVGSVLQLVPVSSAATQNLS